jgi:hypothetical protein
VKDKFKKFVEEYGAIAIITYFVIFFLVFGGAAVAISAGFTAADGQVDTEGAGGWLGRKSVTLGAAYVLTRLTLPFRLAAVFVLTPIIARVYERMRGRPTPP